MYILSVTKATDSNWKLFFLI